MTEVVASRRRRRLGPRRVPATPARADPFSHVRQTIGDAFKKIGQPLDGADLVTVSREQAGIRIEVTKTVAALAHKAMLKLIGSIRFRSLRLSRFRIAAVIHNGKPCFRFSFYIQGVRRGPVTVEASAVEAATRSNKAWFTFDEAVAYLIEAKIDRDAYAFGASRDYRELVYGEYGVESKKVERGRPLFHRKDLNRMIGWIQMDRADRDTETKAQLLQDVHTAAAFLRTHAATEDRTMSLVTTRITNYLTAVEAAAIPPESELKKTYHLSQFSFYLTHRTKPAIRLSIGGYTRDHAAALLKKAGKWPRGYGIAGASGKAVRKTKTEAAATPVEAAKKMSDVNLRKRIADLKHEVALNKRLLTQLAKSKGGAAEDRGWMKNHLQEALAKQEAELEKRLADARERGLRNGSLVNNRKL